MNQTPEAARQTLYPIREVSRLTGVNPITLRAWERRYGLLVPHRTDGGHRLYSLQDIERVRSVTQWIARGVPVSKVAGILDRGDVDEAEAPLDDGAFSRYDFWQQRLDQALLQGDPLLLERLYAQLLTEVPLVTALVSVLRPLHRRQIGGSASAALLDSFLRGRLAQRAGYLEPGHVTLLLVNLQGREAELDMLMVAVLLREIGVNLLLLGDAPDVGSLLPLVEHSTTAAVVLFSDQALDRRLLSQSLPRLNQGVACPVAMAGSCCALQEDELAALGISRLGEVGQALMHRARQLLAGRFDA
ncbi:MAG: helix-turn-helix-type transcriptional regulator [Pseudomonadales bacterium]|nr:helix-turn-helix-type transcriptional regulator [Pseudomonadales bacterium]|tara:strand:- start:51 stop:956 length:906 start_codon:yes stop_codon:yes gene_type:complete